MLHRHLARQQFFLAALDDVNAAQQAALSG